MPSSMVGQPTLQLVLKDGQDAFLIQGGGVQTKIVIFRSHAIEQSTSTSASAAKVTADVLLQLQRQSTAAPPSKNASASPQPTPCPESSGAANPATGELQVSGGPLRCQPQAASLKQAQELRAPQRRQKPVTSSQSSGSSLNSPFDKLDVNGVPAPLVNASASKRRLSPSVESEQEPKAKKVGGAPPKAAATPISKSPRSQSTSKQSPHKRLSAEKQKALKDFQWCAPVHRPPTAPRAPSPQAPLKRHQKPF